MGEAGRAPSAVAAHFGLAAVGVEKTPLKIEPFRRLDEDHPVGAHGKAPPTEQPGQTDHSGIGKLQSAVINQNEIIP